MLFNSYPFLFGFFPIVFFGFYLLGKYSHSLASFWLASASIFFYGWWDARFVGLLLGSIAFNYGAGYLIARRLSKPDAKPKLLLIISIFSNLALLGYFKYASFFIQNFNYIAGTSLSTGNIFLPLGISFFTFTQIAFLVDTYQGKVKEFNFVHYTLFVTYFPHLIAGPVLHHKEMMPQFAKRSTCRICWENIATGLTIFILGLAKKVLIADLFADYASPIFTFVATGGRPMFFESWVGALAYTLQLYFDFSAYSDMAIGLSLMFNIRLPINFNSPYKASSIIEFWRRWHMTLSRFLRDYLYIPLGGSRSGTLRRYSNLMITMLLGGLWHGAGWTFIIWGGLHGLYLTINHLWRNIKEQLGWDNGGFLSNLGSTTLTFLAVVVGWVFFRADSFDSAITLLNGMIGGNGLSLPASIEFIWANYPNYMPLHDAIKFVAYFPSSKLSTEYAPFALIVGLYIVWKTDNVDLTSQRISKDSKSTYLPAMLGMLFGISLIAMRRVSEFLYFQF